MKLILVKLALGAQMLSTVVALPAEGNKPAKSVPATQAGPNAKDVAKADPKGPEAGKNDQHKPIDLEMGKEYTYEVIQAMFAKQSAGTLAASAVAVPKKDTKPVSIAVEKGAFKQSATSKPLNLLQIVAITYQATCWVNHRAWGNLGTTITFDGKQAHFARGLNVDAIDKVTMAGGRGKPLISTAQLQHTVCKAISPTMLCTFFHSLTIKATINVLGNKPSLRASAVQQDDADVAKRSYVQQTCMPISVGYKGPCPVTDPKSAHCNEGKIDVINGN